MGMKPRAKAQKIEVIEVKADLRESIHIFGEALIELCQEHGIHEEDREGIWDDLEDFADLDKDPWAQFYVGWFKGVAECLGVLEEELIDLEEELLLV